MKNAIVLGGTHDHIRLIEILKRKGYYTILIDYYEDPIAKAYADEYIQESTVDKNIVFKISKERKASLVISSCIDSALVTVAYVSEKLNLPCHISYATAQSLTNKVLMKDLFLENNIPTSNFLKLQEGQTIPQNNLIFPLVVKPADANSSKGVRKVNFQSELNSAIEDAFEYSLAKQVIVEEYKEGKELSVDVILDHGEVHIVMITENIKSKLNKDNFTIVQSRYPVEISDEIRKEIIDIASKISKAYKIYTAPLLIQLIKKNKELYVIEFSSRIGGGSKHHFIKYISGFDILNSFVEIILKVQSTVNMNPTECFACINYLYARPGTILKFEGFEGLTADKIIEQYYLYKSPGMSVSGSLNSGDRLAGILISANSKSELEKKSKKSDSKIKFINQDGDDFGIRNPIQYL